jgi:hypothetical protein
MLLFAVHVADSDVVVVKPAHTKLMARTLARDELGVPYTRLTASPEPDVPPTRRRFRCGQVALEALWSHREGQWHVGATFAGTRRYVTIAGNGDLGREGARRAARAAVQFLLDQDDLDEGKTLWVDQPGKAPALHVIEEGRKDG